MPDPLKIATDPLPFTLARLQGRLCEISLDIFNTPPGIYFLIQAGRVAYVGKTTCFAQRLFQHCRTKTFDRILYLPVADPERRSWLETELIRTLRPTLNGHERLAPDAPHYRLGLEQLLAELYGEEGGVQS